MCFTVENMQRSWSSFNELLSRLVTPLLLVFIPISEVIFALQNEHTRSRDRLENMKLEEQIIHGILIISGLKKRFSVKARYSFVSTECVFENQSSTSPQ